MNEASLSEREQRTRSEIEPGPGADRRLDRELRTMRRALPRWACRTGFTPARVPYLGPAVLPALSTALMPATAQARTAQAFGLFAVVRTSTLLAAVAWSVHRWRMRRIP